MATDTKTSIAKLAQQIVDACDDTTQLFMAIGDAMEERGEDPARPGCDDWGALGNALIGVANGTYKLGLP